ncbi:hypothetical protein [Sphingorhabdus lutea]|nr:hypothetical protein [Sphingorhabdus lutea]
MDYQINSNIINAKKLSANIHVNHDDRLNILQLLAQSCGIENCILSRKLPMIDDVQSPPFIDLLLIDISSEMDLSANKIEEICRYIIHVQSDFIIWLRLDQVDEVYGRCGYGQDNMQGYFLVEQPSNDPLNISSNNDISPNDRAAIPILHHIIRQKSGNMVKESTRKEHDALLHQINNELQGFSRMIKGMMGDDENDAPNQLRDAPIGYRPHQSKVESLYKPQNIDINLAPQTGADVRKFIKNRRVRDQLFGEDLFADPVWDMLLDLYACHLDGQMVSVSGLCIAANVPATTALRWISIMTDKNLIMRKADPQDGRRAYIGMTADTVEKMETYFNKLFTR